MRMLEITIAALLLGVWAVHLNAEQYYFTQVVAPGEHESIYAATVNNSGDVAFTAGATPDAIGLYVYSIDDESTSLLLDRSDGILDFSEPDINDRQEIVFWAKSTDFSAIYTIANGNVDVLASTQTYLTFEAGLLDDTPSNPRINNNGDVSFYAAAEVDGVRFEGIFSGADPAADILVHGTEDAFGLSRVSAFYHDMNDAGELVFETNNRLRSNDILRGVPPEFELVASGKCDRTNGDCFDAATPFTFILGVPEINSNGDVVFGASTEGPRVAGYLLRDGDTEPEAVGIGFGLPNRPFIRDDGTVVFGNQRTEEYLGPVGIFAGNDPVKDAVILTDSTLFGEEVSFAYPMDVSGTGQILFQYLTSSDQRGLAIATPQTMPAGDFDNDTKLTFKDIDLLSLAVRDGSTRGLFDVSRDGLVDQADRILWVEELAETKLGDADLDQDVDFADFSILVDNYSSGDRWSTGDFDGSGTADFADFLLLSRNFGSTRIAAVPEASAAELTFLGGLGLLLYRRNRRAKLSSG